MRVLVLSPFPAGPAYGGALVRIQRLAQGLARRHRVWLACRGPLGPAPDFANCEVVPGPSGRLAQLFHPGWLGRLVRLVKASDIEVLLACTVLTGVHAVLLKLLTGRRLVLDSPNVEHLQLRRAGNPLWPAVAALEGTVCRLADRVLCVSETDRRLLARSLGLSPERIAVVPNGADVARLGAVRVDRQAVRQARGCPPGHKVLLFFGVLSYQPNRLAVQALLEEIVPRLKGLPFHLWIAGHGGETLRLGALPAGVSLIGFVDDIAPLIKAADLVLVPLTAGSGTRLKILESVACGTPVVSTSLGAEGLDRSLLGDYLWVADGWEAFAQAVRQRLEEPVGPLPEGFARAYDWQVIVDRDLLG